MDNYNAIGILDPKGENINPLTNKEYENMYKNQIKTINGLKVPATYANLAQIWSTKKVYNYRHEILDKINKNQVTLVIAGTGVGKTVLLPKFALHNYNYEKKVITTIPKKLVTKATASFAAECLDVKLGEEVGYYYKGENKTNQNNKETKLIFTTTGSLISRITGNDPLLKDYSCIIIDEAHERTVQTDQLLLLLKQALMQRSDLKIIIMSATIDLNIFRNYFPKSKFKFGEIDVGSELTFPVTQLWMDKMPTNWHLEAAKITMNILKTTTEGDILIFGRSSSDASIICDKLNQMLIEYHKKPTKNTTKNTKTKFKLEEKILNPICIKLASNSSKEEEDLAKDEFLYKQETNQKGIEYNRKIVVSTNVAESSITIDGIVYVIDSGLEFAEHYFAKKMARSLIEEYAPQSSIIQRKGRAGRTKAGFCYHLYTKSHFNSLKKYAIPSIQKSDITSDVLNLLNLDYIKNIKDLKKLLNEFISPPSDKVIKSSLNTLDAIGSITSPDDNGKITNMGRAISQFRVIKPNMSRSIIASYYYGCYNDVINIVACLMQADGMIENIFMKFRPDLRNSKKENKVEEARYKNIKNSFTNNNSDFLTLLNIYNEFIAQKKKYKQPTITKESLDGIDLEDNVNEVIRDVINITESTEKQLSKKTQNGGGNSEKKLKKWCINNYINYKKIKYVNVLASSIKRKLFDIVKNNKSKKQYIKFKSQEDKILYCFLIGNYIFTARNTIGSIYQSVFPIEKSIGSVNRESFFNLKASTIMYDELFMTNKNAKLLKFNMVNGVPEYLLEYIKPNIIDIIPDLYKKIKKIQNTKKKPNKRKHKTKKKKNIRKKQFKIKTKRKKLLL